MSVKKIIAVVGATGKQGGSLIQAILKEGPKSEYKVRAITRSASSAKAQELKRQGAELAEADVNDAKTLTQAVQGCYGMSCISTLTFDKTGPEKEMAQVKAMATAAKNAGIKHVVWSTLEDTRTFPEAKNIPPLHGYRVPHMDAKGESDKFFQAAKVPTTCMLTSFFYDNLLDVTPLQKVGEGKYMLALPMGQKKMAGIGTEDIGKCALGIFKRPDLIGKRVGIAGDHLTLAEMVAIMSKVLGKDVVYNALSYDTFRSFGFHGAEDITNMFQFFHDCSDAMLAARSLQESRKLNSELLNFTQWMKKHKGAFRLE